MPTEFVLPSKTRIDTFKDNVSIGDAVTYELDCTPWEADNNEIVSATWTIEAGYATISDEAVSDGIVSALVSFEQASKVLISILLTTSQQKKKLWLEVLAKDMKYYPDDYGFSA